jgi:hypothetical protein
MRTICLGLLLVALAACGAPAATSVPTAPPTTTRAPVPTINPTVRAQLTATRQGQADLGAVACRELDAEFARYGATFDHHQDPQITLLELARLMGYDPNAHTMVSDSYVRYTLTRARACQDA